MHGSELHANHGRLDGNFSVAAVCDRLERQEATVDKEVYQLWMCSKGSSASLSLTVPRGDAASSRRAVLSREVSQLVSSRTSEHSCELSLWYAVYFPVAHESWLHAHAFDTCSLSSAMRKLGGHKFLRSIVRAFPNTPCLQPTTSVINITYTCSDRLPQKHNRGAFSPQKEMLLSTPCIASNPKK